MERLYSIYDSKAEAYSPPFVAKTDGLATRTVKGAVVPGTSLYDYPGDFTIFKIGEFDPVSGHVAAAFPPVFVANVSSLVEKALYPPLSDGSGLIPDNRKRGVDNGSAIGDDAPVFGGSSSDDTEEFVQKD